MSTTYFQPIVRGIQNVGSVQILYRYNASDYKLPLTDQLKLRTGQTSNDAIDTTEAGIPIAGFRLDSEFLRANPQIASSFVIPILGGGGVALTNNNRTGTLNLVCARVSAPTQDTDDDIGSMIKKTATSGIGVSGQFADSNVTYYDFVTLAQVQQAQPGGDSVGSTITLKFSFCGVITTVVFEGCTIATVDPIGLAGNDAVNYAIAVNYLNWTIEYSEDA